MLQFSVKIFIAILYLKLMKTVTTFLLCSSRGVEKRRICSSFFS